MVGLRVGRALVAAGGAALFSLQLCWAGASQPDEIIPRPFVLYKGMGSCREWNDARAHSPKKAETLEAFALGWASGYAAWQDDDDHGWEFKFDNAYLFGRVDADCQAHPNGNVPSIVSDILHDEWEKTWRHDR
jgi:hypothetical protein